MARAVYRAAATLITGFMPSFGPTDLKVAGHATGLSRNFKNAGVPCMQGSCSEIYRESAWTREPTRKPAARGRTAWEESIAFLVHPTIDEAMMTEIATLAAEITGKAAMTPL